MLCFLLSYVGFAIGPTSLVPLGLCFVGAGVAIGRVETAQHAAVVFLAPPELRGSAFGLLAGIQGFGNLAASAIAGLLWTWFGPANAFAYLAKCTAMASVTSLMPHVPTRDESGPTRLLCEVERT